MLSFSIQKYYGTTYQKIIPRTWEDSLYTTLYATESKEAFGDSHIGVDAIPLRPSCLLMP